MGKCIQHGSISGHVWFPCLRKCFRFDAQQSDFASQASAKLCLLVSCVYCCVHFVSIPRCIAWTMTILHEYSCNPSTNDVSWTVQHAFKDESVPWMQPNVYCNLKLLWSAVWLLEIKDVLGSMRTEVVGSLMCLQTSILPARACCAVVHDHPQQRVHRLCIVTYTPCIVLNMSMLMLVLHAHMVASRRPKLVSASVPCKKADRHMSLHVFGSWTSCMHVWCD